MKKAKQFLFHAAILTVSSLILRSVQMSFGVFLFHMVGAEVMGVYHLVLAVSFFCVTLAASGIGFAVMKLVSEELALHREERIPSLMKKAVIYCLFFSLFSAALLFFCTPFLIRACFGGSVSALPFYLLALSLPVRSLSSSFFGYFIARRKSYQTAIAQFLEQFFKIGATLAVLFFFLPYGKNAALSALMIGETCGAIAQFFYLWMRYRRDQNGVVCRSAGGQWQRLLRVSLPIALSAGLRSGLSSVKQLMIPARMQRSGVPDAMERYGIINGMIFPLLFFPQVIFAAASSLLIPEITEKYALRQMDSLHRILSLIFKIILIFAVGVGGVFMFYARELCEMLYHNAQIASYLAILAPLVVISYLDDMVDALLKGIDCQVAVARINILDSLIGITLLWYLLPVAHIKGYLAVIFIGEIINGSLSILTLMKHIDFSFRPILWILIPSFVIRICVWSARALFPVSPVFGILLSFGLYVGILYALGILRSANISGSFR